MLHGVDDGDDAVAGDAGNDVLSGGLGSDVLTGGGGSDTFAWAQEPWSPATVTDFDVGIIGGGVVGLAC